MNITSTQQAELAETLSKPVIGLAVSAPGAQGFTLLAGVDGDPYAPGAQIQQGNIKLEADDPQTWIASRLTLLDRDENPLGTFTVFIPADAMEGGSK